MLSLTDINIKLLIRTHRINGHTRGKVYGIDANEYGESSKNILKLYL